MSSNARANMKQIVAVVERGEGADAKKFWTRIGVAFEMLCNERYLDVERRIRDCERRIANLTESLARVGWSDALASKLREEEAQLGKLKAERSAAAKDTSARVVPHPTAIAGYLKNLFALLETDPVRGREVLSRFVAPIVMTPEAEGPARHYRATGAFKPFVFPERCCYQRESVRKVWLRRDDTRAVPRHQAAARDAPGAVSSRRDR